MQLILWVSLDTYLFLKQLKFLCSCVFGITSLQEALNDQHRPSVTARVHAWRALQVSRIHVLVFVEAPFSVIARASRAGHAVVAFWVWLIDGCKRSLHELCVQSQPPNRGLGPQQHHSIWGLQRCRPLWSSGTRPIVWKRYGTCTANNYLLRRSTVGLEPSSTLLSTTAPKLTVFGGFARKDVSWRPDLWTNRYWSSIVTNRFLRRRRDCLA